MVPLIQYLGQNIALDLRVLAQRAMAPHASSVRRVKKTLQRQARYVPPGFVPLVLAGSLLLAVAGLHELVRDHGRSAPRQATRLRDTRIAYANRYPTAP